MAKTDIRVTNDSGGVEPGKEAVILSLRANDEVRWVSDCDQDCMIVFSSNDGSPFKDKVFHLKAKRDVSSGPLSARKQGGVGVYKYSLMGGQGNNDPIIIVKD